MALNSSTYRSLAKLKHVTRAVEARSHDFVRWRSVHLHLLTISTSANKAN